MSGTAGHSASDLLSEQRFVQLAASNAKYETEAAKLALERSRDEKQRDFAEKMIETHSKSMEDLRGMLGSSASLRDAQVPQDLAEQHRTWLEQLRAADQGDFQALYAQQQASAHIVAVDLFRNYAQAGDNEKLKQWAASRLPVLQDHLGQAQALKGDAR